MDMLARSAPEAELINLKFLNLMTIHEDERWIWRDLPRIQCDGMLNPIVVWRTTPAKWHRVQRHTPSMPNFHTEIDGIVYGVKAGNNRVQVAEHLGYNSIAARIFDDHHEAVLACLEYREW